MRKVAKPKGISVTSSYFVGRTSASGQYQPMSVANSLGLLTAKSRQPGGPGGFVVTYNILVSASLGALYSPADYPLLANDLAFLEFVIAFGGGFEVAAGEDLTLVNKRGFPNYQNFAEAFPSVACLDSNNPDNYDVWSTEGANLDLESYFGRTWTWASSACARWPFADDGRYGGDFMSNTTNPVLVIGNLYDPATKYEGAIAARSLLPNSILLSVDLAAHTSLEASPCAGFYTGLYLLEPNSVGFVDGGLCQGLPGNGNPFDLFGGPFGAADTDELEFGKEIRRGLAPASVETCQNFLRAFQVNIAPVRTGPELQHLVEKQASVVRVAFRDQHLGED